MAKATYYIRIDTYWQNSADSFVGPFASRDEAQAEIESAMDDARSAWPITWLPTSRAVFASTRS